MRRISVSNDVSISLHLGTNQSKPLYWSDRKAQMAFYNTVDYKSRLAATDFHNKYVLTRCQNAAIIQIDTMSE